MFSLHRTAILVLTCALWLSACASASLSPLSITVNQAPTAAATATLNWSPPTQNTDGSPLTDLGGYNIHYGTNAASLSQQIHLNDPAASTYVMPNLSSGTWYFAVTAVSTNGLESAYSNTANKTIP
jgi:hypothetical protein